MSEETNQPTAPAAEAPSDELIMCYVSKKMVPISETVEVPYSAGKKHRVLARYIRYTGAE